MKNPALPAAATPVLQAPDADVAEPIDARDLKSLVCSALTHLRNQTSHKNSRESESR